MLVSDKKNLRTLHDRGEKMMPIAHFGGKFRLMVDRRVYLPAESPLGFGQSFGNGRHGDIADDHDIHVT